MAQMLHLSSSAQNKELLLLLSMRNIVCGLVLSAVVGCAESQYERRTEREVIPETAHQRVLVHKGRAVQMHLLCGSGANAMVRVQPYFRMDSASGEVTVNIHQRRGMEQHYVIPFYVSFSMLQPRCPMYYGLGDWVSLERFSR